MKNLKRDKKEPPLKRKITMTVAGAFIALFLLAIAGLAISAHNLLYKSDYFVIKGSHIDWLNEPLTRGPYERFTETGSGENIFRFNISSAAEALHASCPEFKNVWIVRSFPDRLILRIEPRVPLAQVGEKSLFLVDDEGVVLTEADDTIREGLPIITGVGWRLFRKVGQKEDSPRMVKALSLIKAIGQTDFAQDHTLARIDVSNYKNIIFYIEDGLEVKIGHSNFKERLKALDKALASVTVDRDQIRYIDLRFDDVVLGTK